MSYWFIILSTFFIVYASFLPLHYQYYSQQHGGNDISHFVPLKSPFQKGFFSESTIKYSVDADMNIHSENFVKALMGDVKINHSVTVSSKDSLILLDNGNKGEDGTFRHLTIVPEDIVFDAIHGLNEFSHKLENIRFVASLYPAQVQIVCLAELPIIDFTDIMVAAKTLRRKIRINIDGKNSVHESSCIEISEYFGLLPYIELTYFSGNHNTHYGVDYDMIYHLDFHPSKYVRMISDIKPSCFVGMHKLRAETGKDFYHKYPTYRPSTHKLWSIIPQTYPVMTIRDHTVRHVSSISTNYVIMAHKHVSNYRIKKILHNLQCIIKSKKLPQFVAAGTTQLGTSVASNSLMTRLHPGAVDVYRERKYHVNFESDHCIKYNPKIKCPQPKPNLFKYFSHIDARQQDQGEE